MREGSPENSPSLSATEGTPKLGKNMIPKKLFFTKGVGKHKERLTSFELALRDAGIASQNLVRVSSIFPPQAKLIGRKDGLKYLSPGEVVFAVVAENSTREPHRLVASSIGVAIPSDRNTYGYLSEHHSFGETEDQAGEYAEELAAAIPIPWIWVYRYSISDISAHGANVQNGQYGHIASNPGNMEKIAGMCPCVHSLIGQGPGRHLP